MNVYEKLYLRVIEKEDLEKLRKHRNEFDTWKNLTDTDLIHKEQQEAWYQKVIFDKTKKYFVVVRKSHDKEFPIVVEDDIGLVRMDEIDITNRSVRVGCDVFKEFRNKEYGTKIMKLVVEHCFNFMNINRVWLLVAEFNEIAIKMYKKAGFIEEGRQAGALYRFGKYNDYISMYQLKGLNAKI